MKITKIVIENFKSIGEIAFDVKKYGSSYTTTLLGINESGKSNILQAMSYFHAPAKEQDYYTLHNQKDEDNNPVDLWFYLAFENKDTYLDKVRENIENSNLLDFELKDITKNVYLEKGQKIFAEAFDYDIATISKGLFIKKAQEVPAPAGQPMAKYQYIISKTNDEDSSYSELTPDLFNEYFRDTIINIIKLYQPGVSFWKPADEYLLSTVDLNTFKDNPELNIPLKHIFALSGYKTTESIKEKIEGVSSDHLRSRLMSTLQDNVTKYVNNIWDHKIDFIIEITESGKCVVSIKDQGTKNKHDRHAMSARSEGFKQFMSLILSLSIKARELGEQNKLILIDEPEAHLHPSGIRDLRDELLEIGKRNYLFISTHSPFLVDRVNKERNIIIKKNNSALTEKKEIKTEEDIRDDEVLDDAFGINVYKDLLIPHRILVEGASDKTILQKALSIKGINYGITNGTGSNIVQIATKLNHDDIQVFVITDDDNDGKSYRDKIKKIEGVYGDENVFTLRDLVGGMTNEGTIEDLLKKEYIEKEFNDLYKSEFGKTSSLTLDESPIIIQISKFLRKEGKYSEQLIEKFKKNVSNNFNANKSSLSSNFPLLEDLIDKIRSKLE